MSSSQLVKKDLPGTLHTILRPTTEEKVQATKFLQRSLSLRRVQGLCYQLVSIFIFHLSIISILLFEKNGTCKIIIIIKKNIFRKEGRKEEINRIKCPLKELKPTIIDMFSAFTNLCYSFSVPMFFPLTVHQSSGIQE